MIFKLMVNFKPGDIGGSEEKIRVEPATDLCCENLDFLFRVTCVIAKTAFLKIIILLGQRRYQSDPIRSNSIRSPIRSDPIQILLTANLTVPNFIPITGYGHISINGLPTCQLKMTYCQIRRGALKVCLSKNKVVY